MKILPAICNQLCLPILVFIATTAFSTKLHQFYHDEVLVRIHADPNNPISVIENFSDKLINLGYDEWTVNQEYADFRMHKLEVSKLEKLAKIDNMSISVFPHSIQEMVDAEKSSNCPTQFQESASFNYSTYNTWQDIDTWMTDFATEFSDCVELLPAGFSYQGKQINALKFSTNSDNKNALLLTSGFHAREWIGPAHLIYLAGILAEAMSGKANPFLENMSTKPDPAKLQNVQGVRAPFLHFV